MKTSLEELARRFDALAERYDTSAHDVWLKRVRGKALEMAHPQPTDLVLDLGTGTGAVAIELAPQVKEVLALDVSPKMLEKAAQKVAAARLRNVALVHGSILQVREIAERWAGRVNLAMATHVFRYLDPDEKRRAIELVAGLLAPGGRFLIGDVMFFEDPGPHTDLLDADVDQPCKAAVLEDQMRALGLQVTAVKLHPIVGVLRGERAV